ncbi:membrane protein [Mycolicibacterium thermoresistibile]|uniref:Conserved membrane protein n=1 Tax=Mycolicibacterium thermoresistibile TaxID=1797 RepID=A0A100XGZ2_MYCTH|nr:conserved membrane protein [Mycolicibacterium thermoresistibile]SNW20264.1 membrane protein [Mycolicibacterium thermoresistibile]
MTCPYCEDVLDLEPQGPLPAQIYWRRRALALGIAVVVIGIIVAVVAMMVSGGPDAETEAANAEQPAATEEAEAGPTPLPGSDPEVKTPIQPPPQEAPPPTPTPTAAVTPPPVLREGDDCPDSTLAVKGITSQPEYVVGDQPKFTMVVTNIGLVACKRDVGAAVLAAYVYSLDNTRLWSNLDCAPSNETLVKTFNPGEQVTTEVTWTGMGSAPNCPLPREPIGPGTYNLVVQLGNLRSSPVPFILSEAAPVGHGPAPGPAPQQQEQPAAAGTN